jgi:small nuclear ribonucleoprotein F
LLTFSRQSRPSTPDHCSKACTSRISAYASSYLGLKLCLTAYRVDNEIVVRLKWGETEYKGRLVSVDLYMNIQLSNTEEFVGGVSSGTLGQVLIRCNNVLWIGKAEEVQPKAKKDTEMSG